jgi:dihydroflavonol-4-reductase
MRRVGTYYGDLNHPTLARSALNDCEVVFHTAGPVAVWGAGVKSMVDSHVRCTQTVIEYTAADATIVHTSSVVAVGGTKGHLPLNEEHPFNLSGLPVPYVHGKRAAEQLALSEANNDRRVIIVNPGYLIGPEDYQLSVMGRLCLRFWKGNMPAAPRSGFNFVDVRDVAQGHLLAAEHGQSGRRYILGGINLPLPTFLGALARVAEMRLQAVFPIPRRVMPLIAWIAEQRAKRTGREPYPSYQQALLNQLNWYVSSDRARSELGYTTRPLEETIRDTYRWHSERVTFRKKKKSLWGHRSRAA